MILYDGQDYFSSGPCRTEPGPTLSRDAVADALGAIGATVTSQGQAARQIELRGSLIGDSEPALRTQLEAIAARVGGGSATLTDEHGNDWPGCVMRRFEPAAVYRLGPRVAVDYRVSFLQTTP